ncbi:MAG: glycosyltransferase [Bacteroidales bacterium]|nr:glycosyltransferase [Bacteroidales bacterium]
MISVLIPVFNFDVSELVRELSRQAVSAGIEFEIILIDDASEKIFRDLNSKLASNNHVKYSEEPENIGRSKIRNKLAGMAAFPHLLFMDCDSRVPDSGYLANYLKYCNGDIVVCGGRIYENIRPVEKELLLRWKQGKSREEFTAAERNKSPNKSFMTNNFMISKNLFNQIRFSEEIEGYGHEDTLFGYELAKNNITIVHIDNPLVHIGLETNSLFLEKTKESIRNLNNILSLNGYEKMLVQNIRLLSCYAFIKKTKIDLFINFLFRLFGKHLEQNLLGSNPNLLVFDFYKLAYLCKINRNNNSVV